MNNMDPKQQFELKMKTRIGTVKIFLTVQKGDENTFRGTAKVMGVSLPVSGTITGGTHFSLPVSAKLPIGTYNLQFETEVDENGVMVGTASMQGRKPFEVQGRRVDK